MTESLGALVGSRWEPLLSEGFLVTLEEPGRVVLDSDRASVTVGASPRGEVEVMVMPLGSGWPRQWSWSGMVGRADVGRLLELALDRMRAEPPILLGEANFYDRLAVGNRAASHALTRQDEGKGSSTVERRLP